MQSYSTRSASWSHDSEAIMQVRHEVFVLGQNVPSEIESDDFDTTSWYVLAVSRDNQAIGCARLQPNGKLTRIAVLPSWRRRGIARQMLQDILDIAAQQDLNSLYLHAQLSAVDLYTEFGFVKTGQSFEEAGISHIKMTLSY